MIKLDHIVLRVSDFPGAVHFYQTLFDHIHWSEVADPSSKLTLGFRNSDGVTIWINGEGAVRVQAEIGSLDHYAFHCADRANVDQMYEFCLSQDWTILTPPTAYPDYGNFYGFAFEGPDQLKLEFVTR